MQDMYSAMPRPPRRLYNGVLGWMLFREEHGRARGDCRVGWLYQAYRELIQADIGTSERLLHTGWRGVAMGLVGLLYRQPSCPLSLAQWDALTPDQQACTTLTCIWTRGGPRLRVGGSPGWLHGRGAGLALGLLCSWFTGEGWRPRAGDHLRWDDPALSPPRCPFCQEGLRAEERWEHWLGECEDMWAHLGAFHLRDLAWLQEFISVCGLSFTLFVASGAVTRLVRGLAGFLLAEQDPPLTLAADEDYPSDDRWDSLSDDSEDPLPLGLEAPSDDDSDFGTAAIPRVQAALGYA